MNRPALAIAKTLTIHGLMADIACIQIYAAVLFLLDGMWLESLAYGVMGTSVIIFSLAMAQRRVQAILATEERR